MRLNQALVALPQYVVRMNGRRTDFEVNVRIRASVFLIATSLAATLMSVGGSAGAVTPTVTMAVSNTSPDVGQTVTLSGTVSPNRAGQPVTIQRYLAETATWKSVAYPTLNSLSRFSLSRMPTLPGIYKFRVVYSGIKVVKSFTAYRWRYLSQISEVWGDVNSDAISINGTVYPNSVYERERYGSIAYAEWDLKRRCTTFRSIAGVLDDAASDSRYAFSVYADAILRYQGQTSFGESRAISVSTSGSLRLRLEMDKLAGSGYPYAGYGNARIRCSW